MSGFCQEDSMIERCNDAVIEMKEIRAQIEDALADTITAAGNLTDANCSSTETAGNSFTEVVEKLEKISDNLNATADKLVTLHQSGMTASVKMIISTVINYWALTIMVYL